VSSEDRKGVVARATVWIQSLRAEWGTDAGKCYFFVLGVTVLIASTQLPDNGLVPPLVILGIGWVIAYLLKYSISAAEKLRAVRYALLAIAFQECCCKPNSIITEAPGAPELVGKPIGTGYCHVCRCRVILEEHFPGAIEELMQERLNDIAFGFKSDVPEDLAASYVGPDELAYLRERGLGRVGPERFVPLAFTVRKLRK
jgi:hypothetical protein